VFSLVSGEEKQAAMEAIASVNALDIDAATKTLILVEDVYPQYKLFAQGIDELSELIESGTESANIYRLLGDYYIRSGLALPAQESYTQAIALATASENLEEEALARWGMGTVYGRVGEQAQARTYLEAAEAIATTLGDPDLIAGIGAELTRIESMGE
jgi:tetratricopeptide (TPR) repeat protein